MRLFFVFFLLGKFTGSQDGDISIGIIGTGMMGQEHIANSACCPMLRVTALADTDVAMRDEAAALLSE